MNSTLTVWRRTGIGLGVILALGLSGCDKVEMPKFLKKNNAPAAEDSPVDSSSITLVERDVEAPDVFDVTDLALWDGRPSLGGVWVAYPDNIEPERVIIRNTENIIIIIIIITIIIIIIIMLRHDNSHPRFISSLLLLSLWLPH